VSIEGCFLMILRCWELFVSACEQNLRAYLMIVGCLKVIVRC